MTPSIEQALLYDFWKTREVKTSSGTFTVPSNVYAVGIFCLGAGSSGNPGGGGGLAMKIKRVNPGDTISYTISAGIATCDSMAANPASGQTGGTAAGGMYNYTGGSSGSGRGGGGCGGNALGTDVFGGGSMRHWGQTSAPTVTYISGGMGMNHTAAVESSRWVSTDRLYGGGGFGAAGKNTVADRNSAGGQGRAPTQLGIFVTSDVTGNNSEIINAVGQSPVSATAGDWIGGNYATENFICAGGLGAGGGFKGASSSVASAGGAGGPGGGGGSCIVTGAQGIGGSGGLGAGGGASQVGSPSVGGAGGYGGGGGFGSNTVGAGGSSVVIFVF
jgi:hypothetical protein